MSNNILTTLDKPLPVIPEIRTRKFVNSPKSEDSGKGDNSWAVDNYNTGKSSPEKNIPAAKTLSSQHRTLTFMTRRSSQKMEEAKSRLDRVLRTGSLDASAGPIDQANPNSSLQGINKPMQTYASQLNLRTQTRNIFREGQRSEPRNSPRKTYTTAFMKYPVSHRQFNDMCINV